MLIHPSNVIDRAIWNTTLAQMPYAHVLQTWEWGDFKAATTGWVPERIAYMHQSSVVAMAQILTRQIGPFKMMYVPKGPALDYTDPSLRAAVLDDLKRHVHQQDAIFLKIDPDVVTGVGVPGAPDAFDDPTGLQIAAEWQAAGLRLSHDQVQFRNSIVIDLRRSEDELMAAMKQKTRYNVRLADKRGVATRLGTLDDLALLYRLYAETARRDGFVIRPLTYYRQAWVSFMQAGLAQPIIAEYKGEAIAHVIIFGLGKRAWYIYGASADEERKHMPTYLLQWEAISWAKAQGMAVYDLWGAPDDFKDENDPLAGVFRFKEGFGGVVARRIGAWDYAAKPLLYTAYTRVMPMALNVMRGFGRRRMQQEDIDD
ncbi:MAG: peptidoglycan bridge formation glycyltransferase FemA/FemB family protein [Anaerolineae bacterium]|nr:peptidoglycan bridge formation glycyltransferase FemA/FemB family protein [Anaerolineae bacterium]